MKIINIEYNQKTCPNCGRSIIRPGEDSVGLKGCYFSETCDEGGGCTGYVVVCHNKENK
jgi:hypothetical protein